MNRDMRRRIRRLEMDQDTGGVRFVVSDRPLSDEDWAAGPPFPEENTAGQIVSRRGAVTYLRTPEMTTEEWVKEFCHGDQPAKH